MNIPWVFVDAAQDKYFAKVFSDDLSVDSQEKADFFVEQANSLNHSPCIIQLMNQQFELLCGVSFVKEPILKEGLVEVPKANLPFLSPEHYEVSNIWSANAHLVMCHVVSPDQIDSLVAFLEKTMMIESLKDLPAAQRLSHKKRI